ncbi:hypothetical protein D3C85_1003030 [compost metagenome]
MTQDKCGDLNTMDTGKSPDFHAGDGVWHGRSHSFLEGSNRVEVASDYATAVVTKEQWQAERDRQGIQEVHIHKAPDNGGEWKRHRGGKCPVDAGQKVGYKFRGGDQGECLAGHLMWDHQQDESDVMQYRVISQPQAEEVEVIEQISTYKEFEVIGQWHQIDGPLAWRDRIIHCQAIIEDCEREIAKNENLLALEGFSLIPAITPVAGVADVDMGDWRNWAKGDIVEVILPNDSGLGVGKQYAIQKIEDPEYIFGMPVNVIDEAGDDYWPEDDEGEGRLVFKFIRRP